MMLKMEALQLLLFSLLLSIISVAAISPGSTLYASDTSQVWSSPNNTFSLHFVPVQPPTSPPSFMAGIVYSGGVPVIWIAGNSASVDYGGSFRFLSTGSLCLVNGSGATVWDSGTSHMGVSSAFLDEQGNLVLSNDTSTVWSSFDHPTDTIVPSQNFTVGMVLKSGLYSFTLLGRGNLTLRWNDSVPYWDHGFISSTNGNLTSPVLELQSKGILQIVYPKQMTPVVVAYSSDHSEGKDVLRILKLDTDGNLRIYSFSRASGTGTVTWAAVEDQCLVFGYCGNYGICSYHDSSPICSCLSQNFEMIDPNDSRRGCRRKVSLEDCSKSHDRVATMLQLEHAEFLTYPPQLVVNPEVLYIPFSACRGDCLSADSCLASTSLSDGTGLCYTKTTPFISGYLNPALTSTSFIKVCGPLVPNPPPSVEKAGKEKHWSVHAWIIVVVVLGTLSSFISFEGCLWFWCCKNNPRFGSFSAQFALLEYASCVPVQLSYKELKRSTKGFKEKLGAGEFGAVYKGILGNKTVAVKQLEGIKQGENQFRMEVSTLNSTHHLNLVRLIGFCSEGGHRLVVYEYMENGSLDNFLFFNKEESGKLLNWEYRFNIALGAARALTYLHDECRNCIVHCGIKPENILLDENYNAKVSDFGLRMLLSPKDHWYGTLTSERGTEGYLAPELLTNLSITSKSDVYSYGLVLLEIVSGRRNSEVSEETNRKKFSIWAYEEFEKGNMKGVIDKRLSEHLVNLEEVKRVLLASFWCIQEQPSQRPTMGKLVQMLEGIIEIERPPAPKSLTEGSASWTGSNMSINANPFSMVATSSAPCSLSSSDSIGAFPMPAGRNKESATSSLLLTDP